MTRSYGMIFFFFGQWTIRFTVDFVSVDPQTYIVVPDMFIYLLSSYSWKYLKLHWKTRRKNNREKRRECKKTNCPVSPLDTTTAEKLEHQVLSPGSRWKKPSSSDGRVDPASKYLGCGSTPHLAIETAVAKQLLLKLLD